MTKKAVVLAAGYGTRLRPFTAAVPKPLLPVWGEPMLGRVVGWLRSLGVDDIVVNCHYLHEQIEEWCAANGCRAVYEPEILGTGGVLNPLRDWIGGDDFYLVNGDIVFEASVSSFDRFIVLSSPTQNDQTIKRSNDQTIIGRCIVTEEGPRTIEVEPDMGLVTNWHSPDPGWSGTWTYCGIALLKAEILDYVKPQGFSSIIEAYEAAMMDGKFIQTIAPNDMLWTDAGTVESYIALNEADGENAFEFIPQVRSALCSLRSPCLVHRASCLVDARTKHEEQGTRHGASEANVAFCGARGSDRAFFKAGDAYIIVYDDAKRPENAKYAHHAKWLKEHGIRVPAVLADIPQMKTLVLENAGAEDLQARSKSRGEDRLYDYVAVVEELARFSALDASCLVPCASCLVPGDEVDDSCLVPGASCLVDGGTIKPSNHQTIKPSGASGASAALEPAFDAALYQWERDLFAEHCLGTRFHMEMPAAVEKELEQVAARLLAEPPALVHRDFQSTNIVFRSHIVPRSSSPCDEKTKHEARGTKHDFSIIDFQGMRMGAAAYDLASLLYDPYVDLREGERRGLAALYAKKAGRPEIVDVLPFAAVERLVQALGAYGRLASVGKPEFGRYVMPALQNLLAAADDAGLDAIGALAEDLIAKEGAAGHGSTASSNHHHEHCDCGHHHEHCGCGHHHGHDDKTIERSNDKTITGGVS